MTITTAEARQQLLDALAAATEDIGLALGALGDAYELLDDASADKLEERLFGPVQAAYGRAKRTHAEFADRHGLPGVTFESRAPGLPSTRAKGFIDNAVEAAGRADRALAGLQDSPLPVEVGDVALRAELTEVRELIGGVSRQARELLRTLGR